MLRSLPRAALALAATLLAGLALAPAASAHVRVSSPDAAPGGFATLVFRVPTESATARTTALTVTLPDGTPFASVSAGTKPGWTVATTTAPLAHPLTDDDGVTLTKAVHTVTWTATGDGIPAGQFDQFLLTVGPLPKGAGEIAFPAAQRLSDGTSVSWDQAGVDAEHPAPVLTVAGAASHADDLARWLGGAGLVAGVLALALAATSALRRRPTGGPRA
ncbi:uncharacterized protein YcnI [Motilibacter rhizosphaerae]|uniref:Uncharacterized protein YcnI n=1 Tax=Motilibacter rhizosphaerae TaxID=598652 RepID=A0A4Q7NSB3_9ACTN|nr:YcnI family protein [Motilibacter rhizosphaerae]RZS89905.1 uncharacterized protein YcnI [Motilibacter rhizosphaerae]